ncbi:MAG TPA: preprotein translocase subunit SecY [Candidatus Sumerlaeota bacterium]|nr:preprotein translocase subunit SecY [Candidatus Sumerlaeota bacterium]
MLKTFGNIFKIPDLKKKVLFTLFIVFVYRLGCHVPIPFIDAEAMNNFWANQFGSQGLFNIIDMFSGRAFKQMTVFALGIMPYITASIIIQLLMVVWPYLEKIAKEGEIGQKKINQYTRYGTVAIAAFQSLGVSFMMLGSDLTTLSDHKFLFVLCTMMTMTTGTTLIMWLGEKITESGIGNGISIIIAVGIMASYPMDVALSIDMMRQGHLNPMWFVVILVLFVLLSVLIIMMHDGTRRIPIQHAKRIVGRRVMSGSTTYLPLKVNQAGVIPVIFSAAILSFIGLLLSFVSRVFDWGFLTKLTNFTDMTSQYNLYNMLGMDMRGAALLLRSINFYTIFYSLATIFFCFFYTAITFNPIDTAENLKKYGAFIPGRRQGKPTSDHIDFILTRLTLVGSIFLVGIALLPMVLNISFNVPWVLTDLIGGVGLIIVVDVFLETMKQVESQLLMRHYEGFSLRKKGRTGRW